MFRLPRFKSTNTPYSNKELISNDHKNKNKLFLNIIQFKNFSIQKKYIISKHITNINYCNYSKMFGFKNISKKNIENTNHNFFSMINNLHKNFSNLENKISPISNKNVCFLKKLENFRNNKVNYRIYNTEAVFQTIWSDFAYLCLIDHNKTFDNNLNNNDIDFTKIDDDTYTIFQDESNFRDYENENLNFDYSYEFNPLDKKEFFFKKINNSLFTLITRIPQEFNLNIITNESLKILNMGDSKLLADKEIYIEFSNMENYLTAEDKNNSKNNINKSISLDVKRLRANKINILSEHGFKLKITGRSYLEGQNLNLNLKDESQIRIKKIGINDKGNINLIDSEIDVRSIFAPKDLNENNILNDFEIKNKFLEFNCINSKLNFGSIQGNLNLTLDSCNLVIDNLDTENLILNSKNTKSLEIFIYSLDKLSNKNFFFLKFEDSVNFIKNKKIFLNEDNKDDVIIIKINNKDNSDFFNIIYGENNFLSSLTLNDINLNDLSDFKKLFYKFRDEKILEINFDNLNGNRLFFNIDVENSVKNNVLLLNYFIKEILINDKNYNKKFIFIDTNHIESFDIRSFTAWDYTKLKIKNKISNR